MAARAEGLAEAHGLEHCAQLARVEQSCRSEFARADPMAGREAVPASAQTGRMGCITSEASKLMAAVAAFTAAGADFRRRLLLDRVLKAASRLRRKSKSFVQ